MKKWQSFSLFRFLSSLRLAVFSILLLAAVLSVATVMESLYGMRGAYVLVYGEPWFYGVLSLLGINVFCAAMSRWPWKRHQTGFVITHSGILLLLVGSWITMRFGVDGNLPVVEGASDSEVILNRLELVVGDPDVGKSQSFPITESATASEGKLLQVLLPGEETLEVQKFLPRVRVKRAIESAPKGLGVPAIHVEVFNDRFSLDEWILADQLDSPRELNLGPAIFSLEKLWNRDQEKQFFVGKSPPKAPRANDKIGTLIVTFQGKEHSFSITPSLKKWVSVGDSGLKVHLDRYLPFAIVEKNQLVNKSPDPGNPALELTVRGPAGIEEKHVTFAFFPEYATLHAKTSPASKDALEVKLRMISAEQASATPANVRGRLFFAQTADGSKLLYRITGATEEKRFGQGEVEVGKAVPTGWMDLQFRVVEWFPAAVEFENPEYVPTLKGTETFPSAVQVVHRKPGSTPSAADTHWIIEGGGLPITNGNRTLEVRFQRERMPLPFQIFLKKFKMDTDPGTTKAATYESEVRVVDASNTEAPEAKISMNEPLQYGGYTFYQASYQLRPGAPSLSVFSVNQDPGRWIKYLGSLVMTLGTLLMFYMNPHYWNIVLGMGRKEK
jgi:hypothetical protein